MILFSTPSSTTESVFQTVSANLAKPGLFGIIIVAVGLVATFWIIEMLIRNFSNRPLIYDNETSDDDDDDHWTPGGLGRSFDKRS